MSEQAERPIATQEDIEVAYKRIKGQEEEISALIGYLANVKRTAVEHLSLIEEEKSKATLAQESATAAIEASKGKSQELVEILNKTVANANTEIQERIADFQSAKEAAENAANTFKETEKRTIEQAQQLDAEQSNLQKRMESANKLHDSLKEVLDAVHAFEAQTQQTKARAAEDAKAILALKNDCEKFKLETYSRAEEATARKEQLDKEFKGLQEAIVGAQKTLAELAESVKSQKDAAATITAQFQQQFSEAQEKRLNDYNSHINKLGKDIETFKALASSDLETQKKKLDKDIEEKITSLTSQVEDALQSMEEKNHKASKLLEAVGVKTHTYNYAAVSEKEGKTANNLRWGALAFMVIAITVLVAPSVMEAFKTGTSLVWKDIWQSMLMRLPLSLVLFFPAVYLITESSKHRKVERENKRIELELAALTPYLELFADDKKQAIKAELVKNYFVGHAQEGKEQEKEEVNSWVQELVPKVLGEVLNRIPGLK